MPFPNRCWIWGTLSAQEELTLLATLTFVVPSAPFFVVMITTPSAARDPYKDAAAAPLSTERDSMSSGLMSITRFEYVVLSRDKPSVPVLPTTVVELS